MSKRIWKCVINMATLYIHIYIIYIEENAEKLQH